MKKPSSQAQPPASEEIRAACDLIQTDNNRLLAAEAYLGGASQQAYNQLANLDPGDLKDADRIRMAFYRLGLSPEADSDAEFVMKHVRGLERRRHN